jgi:uncharacterized protein (DUF1800 family)
MAVAATAAACGTAKSSPTTASGQSKPATSQPTPIPHLSAPATPLPATQPTEVVTTGVPLEIIALNRLAFGPRPADLVNWRARGASEEEILSEWVETQLNPEQIDDSAVEAKLAQFSTLTKGQEQTYQEHVVASQAMMSFPWEMYIQPMTETLDATFIRLVHSQRQLLEVLVDFWHNHFNVYRETDNTPPYFSSYDRDVIRPHALGNFRQMLEAVAQHPAMLYYLDNANNQVLGPNENFARELFELHTLGAENYLGVQDPMQVEKLPDGTAMGYVDNDVYEAARCFTGWRVGDNYGGWEEGVPSNGLFHYHRPWHDRFNKLILGQYFPADEADLADGRRVLDILARHPGTARFISRKLARRLVSDNPSEALVEQAVQTFLAHADSPDQIKHVIRTLVYSDEFKQTWGAKVKRPLESIASLLRALDVNFDALPDSFYWFYEQSGQPVFGRRPPDGYPDKKDAWTSTNTLLPRWNFGVALLEGWMTDESQPILAIDLRAQMPPELRTARTITDYWIDRLLGRPLMNANHRVYLEQFMAGPDFSPTDELPDDYLNWRMIGLVELMAMTPDFLLR